MVLSFYLTGKDDVLLYVVQPCAADGSFLDKPIPDPTPSPPHSTSDNLWAPFQDRLAFNQTCYHYVQLQSLANDINKGLNHWHATIIKHESKHGQYDGVSWDSAGELYATIDSITTGGVSWKTCVFHYTGPKPPMPPQWMEKMYELNVRDDST